MLTTAMNTNLQQYSNGNLERLQTFKFSGSDEVSWNIDLVETNTV